MTTIPIDRKVDEIANCQHLSLQETPNFAQIAIFGLKIYHLATLSWT
jgi:hypothetical protein